MKFLKKLSNYFFSTSAAGLYMILFAAAIGIATFVENDFGTSAAQKVIFKSRWFELLLILFGISLIVNIFRYRMIQQKKWAILTFHASMIIILLGAGVTRYFGYEGVMHIREGSASNSFLSAETYLNFEAMQGGNRYLFNEPVLFASLGKNHFHESYLIGNDNLEVEVMDFIPNPTEVLLEDEANGLPTLKVVFGSANGREEYYIRQGDRKNINGILFNFSEPEVPNAFNIKFENKNIFFKTNTVMNQMVMATQTKDTLSAGMYHPLMLRSLYSGSIGSFVMGEFHERASVEMQAGSQKMASNSNAALDIAVRSNGQEQRQMVYGIKGMEGNPKVFNFGNTQLAISYGSKRVVLPFSIQLYDFIMERYPGTNSASSYASEVALIDQRENLKEDHRIYMNHILDYDGYRFFQSSFDQDELGTYLSVNHDFWGTWISYIGYILLTLGMIMTFFDTKSRFRKVGESIKKMRQSRQAALSVLIIGLIAFSQTDAFAFAPIEPNTKTAAADHAEKFGHLLVQDYKGRIKPMNTFNREVVRKLSRKESLYGLTADQIILGMASFTELWNAVPLIKIGKNEKIQQILNTDQKLIAYNDFFGPGGTYLLKDYVREAYNTPQKDRGTFEKELMKLDEKVNICAMVFSGRFMRVFPVQGDENNTWISPDDMEHKHDFTKASGFAEKFYPAYIPTLRSAVETGDYELANTIIAELKNYQYTHGDQVIPSDGKINAELFLNEINVFSRLGKVYGLLGLGFLTLLFMSVFSPNRNLSMVSKGMFGILAWHFCSIPWDWD
ncbi:MAG: cytochrome c biogenesis protein ResB [Saprospiraceae bacterium]